MRDVAVLCAFVGVGSRDTWPPDSWSHFFRTRSETSIFQQIWSPEAPSWDRPRPDRDWIPFCLAICVDRNNSVFGSMSQVMEGVACVGCLACLVCGTVAWIHGDNSSGFEYFAFSQSGCQRTRIRNTIWLTGFCCATLHKFGPQRNAENRTTDGWCEEYSGFENGRVWAR